MVAAVKYQLFAGVLINNGGPSMNLGSDIVKLVLGDTAPNQAWEVYSSLTGELTTANGYTAGGASLSSPSTSNASGVWSINGTPAAPTWTGTTGDWSQFRYIHAVDTTPATKKPLICSWDYGSELIIKGGNGDTFALTFSTTNVLMTIS